MKKARSLREALIKAVPQLEINPEMMRIFADEGNIDARLAASLSHEKIYTLNVIVCDFVGDPDMIFVPVAAWLRENQPDICTLDDGRKKGYRFQMDLNDGTASISASACSSTSEPLSKRKTVRCT